MVELIQAIYSNDQVRYLAALILANLALGIVASLKNRDFRLSSVADFLETRLVPMVTGYGAAALVSLANPDMGYVRDAAFYALVTMMLGFLFVKLREFGIPLPDQIAGQTTSLDYVQVVEPNDPRIVGGVQPKR